MELTLRISPAKYEAIAQGKLVPMSKGLADLCSGKKVKLICNDSKAGTEEQAAMNRYLHTIIDNYTYWSRHL